MREVNRERVPHQEVLVLADLITKHGLAGSSVESRVDFVRKVGFEPSVIRGLNENAKTFALLFTAHANDQLRGRELRDKVDALIREKDARSFATGTIARSPDTVPASDLLDSFDRLMKAARLLPPVQQRELWAAIMKRMGEELPLKEA